MQVFMHYTTWKTLKYYYLKNLVFMLCSTNKWKSFPFSAWLYIYMILCSLRSFEWHIIKIRRLSCIIKTFIFLRNSVIKNQCILTILKCKTSIRNQVTFYVMYWIRLLTMNCTLNTYDQGNVFLIFLLFSNESFNLPTIRIPQNINMLCIVFH